MEFFLLLRKADELGINFWLRLLALGLCLSLFFLVSYYFLIINRDTEKPLPTPMLTSQESDKKQADAALSARIRSAIMRTKRLYNLNIGVENKSGSITLTGEVPTEIDKELAGTLAQETSGVKAVHNQLQVLPGIHRTNEPTTQDNAPLYVEDLEMEANLREQLQAQAELKGQPILLKVNHRAVTLTGRVATEQQRLRAEQVLRNAPKVSSISNQLRVGN